VPAHTVRVGVELERGDDAEVAAGAAQRPDQVGILAGVRADDPAVGQHQFGRCDVVDGEGGRRDEIACRSPESGDDLSPSRWRC
jgi:hypothetical protein